MTLDMHQGLHRRQIRGRGGLGENQLKVTIIMAIYSTRVWLGSVNCVGSQPCLDLCFAYPSATNAPYCSSVATVSCSKSVYSYACSIILCLYPHGIFYQNTVLLLKQLARMASLVLSTSSLARAQHI